MEPLPLLSALSRLDLAALIISLRPQAADGIFPDGPLSKADLRTAISRDAVFAGKADQAQVEAAAMVREVVRVAVELNLRGDERRAVMMVGELVDDWCGTPWPRKFPRLWPGPRRDVTSINDARLVGAIAFASFADHMEQGALHDVFAKGAEQLLEASFSR